MKTNTSKNKNGHGNKEQVAVALAKINEQISTLQQQRAGLAEPLKVHYGELRSQLGEVETQIRELDPSWKPASLRPRAEERLKTLIEENGKPMSVDEILAAPALNGVFSKWKVKNTLKKKSTGPKAVFSLENGRYGIRTVTA